LLNLVILFGHDLLSRLEIYHSIVSWLLGFCWVVWCNFDEFAFVSWGFSLAAFNSLSLFCSLGIVTVMWREEVLFWSCVFGFLNASYAWMSLSFPRFGDFFFLFFLFNRFALPLVCILVSSTSWILGFGLSLMFQSSWKLWPCSFILSFSLLLSKYKISLTLCLVPDIFSSAWFSLLWCFQLRFNLIYCFSFPTLVGFFIVCFSKS
jgi:hypothetical protein